MQNFRALGAPPLDPRASGVWGPHRLSSPKQPTPPPPPPPPPPFTDFWLRACYMLFVYVAVELNTFIMLI